MSNIEEIKKELRRALEDKVKSTILPKATNPALAIIIQIGVPTTIIAKALGVTQGTASAYTRGIKKLPQKHIPIIYSLLEIVVQVVGEILDKVEKFLPSSDGGVNRGQYNWDMTNEEYEKIFRDLFFSEKGDEQLIRVISQDGYEAVCGYVNTAATLLDKWYELNEGRLQPPRLIVVKNNKK